MPYNSYLIEKQPMGQSGHGVVYKCIRKSDLKDLVIKRAKQKHEWLSQGVSANVSALCKTSRESVCIYVYIVILFGHYIVLQVPLIVSLM